MGGDPGPSTAVHPYAPRAYNAYPAEPPQGHGLTSSGTAPAFVRHDGTPNTRATGDDAPWGGPTSAPSPRNPHDAAFASHPAAALDAQRPRVPGHAVVGVSPMAPDPHHAPDAHGVPGAVGPPPPGQRLVGPQAHQRDGADAHYHLHQGALPLHPHGAAAAPAHYRTPPLRSLPQGHYGHASEYTHETAAGAPAAHPARPTVMSPGLSAARHDPSSMAAAAAAAAASAPVVGGNGRGVGGGGGGGMPARHAAPQPPHEVQAWGFDPSQPAPQTPRHHYHHPPPSSLPPHTSAHHSFQQYHQPSHAHADGYFAPAPAAAPGRGGDGGGGGGGGVRADDDQVAMETRGGWSQTTSFVKTEKRSRQKMACVFCRTSKIKCNGENPCLHCSRRGSECVYTAVAHDAAPAAADTTAKVNPPEKRAKPPADGDKRRSDAGGASIDVVVEGIGERRAKRARGDSAPNRMGHGHQHHQYSHRHQPALPGSSPSGEGAYKPLLARSPPLSAPPVPRVGARAGPMGASPVGTVHLLPLTHHHHGASRRDAPSPPVPFTRPSPRSAAAAPPPHTVELSPASSSSSRGRDEPASWWSTTPSQRPHVPLPSASSSGSGGSGGIGGVGHALAESATGRAAAARHDVPPPAVVGAGAAHAFEVGEPRAAAAAVSSRRDRTASVSAWAPAPSSSAGSNAPSPFSISSLIHGDVPTPPTTQHADDAQLRGENHDGEAAAIRDGMTGVQSARAVAVPEQPQSRQRSATDGPWRMTHGGASNGADAKRGPTSAPSPTAEASSSPSLTSSPMEQMRRQLAKLSQAMASSASGRSHLPVVAAAAVGFVEKQRQDALVGRHDASVAPDGTVPHGNDVGKDGQGEEDEAPAAWGAPDSFMSLGGLSWDQCMGEVAALAAASIPNGDGATADAMAFEGVGGGEGLASTALDLTNAADWGALMLDLGRSEDGGRAGADTDVVLPPATTATPTAATAADGGFEAFVAAMQLATSGFGSLPSFDVARTTWWDHLTSFFSPQPQSGRRLVFALLNGFWPSVSRLYAPVFHAPTLLDNINHESRREAVSPALAFAVCAVAVRQWSVGPVVDSPVAIPDSSCQAVRRPGELSEQLREAAESYLDLSILSGNGASSLATAQAAFFLSLLEPDLSRSQLRLHGITQAAARSREIQEAILHDVARDLSAGVDAESVPRSSVHVEECVRLRISPAFQLARLVRHRPDVEASALRLEAEDLRTHPMGPWPRDAAPQRDGGAASVHLRRLILRAGTTVVLAWQLPACLDARFLPAPDTKVDADAADVDGSLRRLAEVLERLEEQERAIDVLRSHVRFNASDDAHWRAFAPNARGTVAARAAVARRTGVVECRRHYGRRGEGGEEEAGVHEAAASASATATVRLSLPSLDVWTLLVGEFVRQLEDDAEEYGRSAGAAGLHIGAHRLESCLAYVKVAMQLWAGVVNWTQLYEEREEEEEELQEAARDGGKGAAAGADLRRGRALPMGGAWIDVESGEGVEAMRDRLRERAGTTLTATAGRRRPRVELSSDPLACGLVRVARAIVDGVERHCELLRQRQTAAKEREKLERKQEQQQEQQQQGARLVDDGTTSGRFEMMHEEDEGADGASNVAGAKRSPSATSAATGTTPRTTSSGSPSTTTTVMSPSCASSVASISLPPTAAVTARLLHKLRAAQERVARAEELCAAAAAAGSFAAPTG